MTRRGRLVKAIESLYPKEPRGRSAIDLEQMLPLYVLRQWCNRVNKVLEDMLEYRTSVGRCECPDFKAANRIGC